MGSHVRLMEEPERYAWQSEVGTAVLPWLRDHQIHNVAALPGAAYCEMALAAAHRVLKRPDDPAADASYPNAPTIRHIRTPRDAG